jgi:hypothetical protein
MFRSSTVLLALVFLATKLAADQQPKRATQTVYFPSNLYLVGAKNLKITKGEGPSIKGTFVVTRVYAGSEKLKGKQFQCSTRYPMMGSQLRVSQDR